MENEIFVGKVEGLVPDFFQQRCFLRFSINNPTNVVVAKTEEKELTKIVDFSEIINYSIPVISDVLIEICVVSPINGIKIIDSAKIPKIRKYSETFILKTIKNYSIELTVMMPKLCESIECNSQIQNFRKFLISVFSKNEQQISIVHSAENGMFVDISNHCFNQLSSSRWNFEKMEEINVYSICVDSAAILGVWHDLYLFISNQSDDDASVNVCFTGINDIIGQKSLSIIKYLADIKIAKSKSVAVTKIEFTDCGISLSDCGAVFDFADTSKNLEEIKKQLFSGMKIPRRISCNEPFEINSSKISFTLDCDCDDGVDLSLVQISQSEQIKEKCFYNMERPAAGMAFITNKKSIFSNQMITVNMQRIPKNIAYMLLAVTSYKHPLKTFGKPIIVFSCEREECVMTLDGIETTGFIVAFIEKKDGKWYFNYKGIPCDSKSSVSVAKEAIKLFFKYDQNFVVDDF